MGIFPKKKIFISDLTIPGKLKCQSDFLDITYKLHIDHMKQSCEKIACLILIKVGASHTFFSKCEPSLSNISLISH